MPKLDVEAAKDTEYLDGFVKYLKAKREKCFTPEERHKYSRIIYYTECESLASVYIRNAWLTLKLAKMRDLPKGETE